MDMAAESEREENIMSGSRGVMCEEGRNEEGAECPIGCSRWMEGARAKGPENRGAGTTTTLNGNAVQDEH